MTLSPFRLMNFGITAGPYRLGAPSIYSPAKDLFPSLSLRRLIIIPPPDGTAPDVIPPPAPGRR
jgi:hypothetical protein